MNMSMERILGLRNEFIPVGREKELDFLDSSLKRIKTSGFIFQTIFEFYGSPGIGKTTLLTMMRRQCQQSGIQNTYVDFHQKNNSDKEEPLDPVNVIKGLLINLPEEGEGKELIKEAIKEFKKKEKDIALDVVGRCFQRYIGDLSKKGPVVMMFDSAEQADKKTRDWLEEWVISPISQNGKIIFIWASKRPERWKRFEVRRRVVDDGWKLEGFDEEANAKQYYEQSKASDYLPLFQSMQTIVSGHPLANEIIIDTINKWAKDGETFDSNKLLEYHQELIAILKEKFVEGYVFEEMHNPAVKKAIEMMSVIRQFDVIQLRGIISKDEIFNGYGKNNYGFFLNLLRSSGLIIWDDSRKGYAVDNNFRRLLNLWLLQDNPDLFVELQKKAIEDYDRCIEQAGYNAPLYIDEKLYQLANLRLVNKNSGVYEVINLVEILEKDLEKIPTEEGSEHSASIKKMMELLETDVELRSLITKEEFEELSKKITVFKSSR